MPSKKTTPAIHSDMPKNLTFRQCLQHLYTFIRPNQKKLWAGLIMVVITNLTYIAMPVAEGRITSQLQMDVTSANGGSIHVQMDVIVHLILILLSIYLIKITGQFLSTIWMTDSIQKTMYDLRNAIEHKINCLPVAYFDAHKTGDLLSRITNDVETVSNALQQTLSRIIGAFLSTTLILIMMFTINRVMFGMVVLGIPLIITISVFIVRKTQPIFDEQQEALATLNSTVNEMYGGLSEIMIYNQQDFAKKAFDEANERMYKTSFKAQTLSGQIGPWTTIVIYIEIGLCCLYGIFQVISGHLMLGSLQAFIRYIWNVNDPLSQLSSLSSAVQSAFSGMNRLFSFLDLDEEEQTLTQKPIDEIKEIDFRHIRFSYTDQPLMEDVSFHVDRNQTVAIVGHTGAGKTTLTNLLERYYPLDGGQIAINGQNINDLSFEDLRDLIGLVLQDPWLFEGTIEENLKYAKDNLSDEQIHKAIETARLTETLAALPDGLQTELNEDAQNLSQGEKQLLTIARALLKDPKILILDEATSSVDTRLEKRLQAAMNEVMKNRTCFVIAHRLSTILNANLILVMDHGDLVESGTHEELLARGGTYARLYNSQFQDPGLNLAG